MRQFKDGSWSDTPDILGLVVIVVIVVLSESGFEAEGVEFIGSVRVHSGERSEDVVLRGRPSQGPPLRRSQDVQGAELTMEQLRESFDTVVVATGLTADASLEVPGAVVDGARRKKAKKL